MSAMPWIKPVRNALWAAALAAGRHERRRQFRLGAGRGRAKTTKSKTTF